MPKIQKPVTRGLDIMYSIITFLKIEGPRILRQLGTAVQFTRPYARLQTALPLHVASQFCSTYGHV
jgi:hypothetical protein